ncbi:MAG: peptidase domain-containing ABC transporter [Oscillospiraceae bacterium]|nr:peptidase domain-containing ABC transporter [Oscillospiraceae bacterium]
MKYPHIQQHDEKDCGAACLSMISEFYGSKLTIAKCRSLIKVDNMGANIYGIITGAKEIGLESEGLEGDYGELLEGINNNEIKFPFIARIINEEGYEHFIVVYAVKNRKLIIGDPAEDKITSMSEDKFILLWQDQIITFEPDDKFEKKDERKGSFTKYFKYILSQKKLLAAVFFLSLIIIFINVSSSVIFQYVISDIENPGHSANMGLASGMGYDGTSRFMQVLKSIESKFSIIYANLTTVCISIICLYLIKILIQILRGYFLTITAKSVDIPLTLNYYDHLLDLPIGFYGTRKTGEYMSRFNDTNKIRDAVSSAALSLILDTIMAVSCGFILYFINRELFIITVLIMLIYAVIVFAFKNPIKSVNHEIMEQNAKVTSYLKESIDGIETIKSFQYENEAKNTTRSVYQAFADKNVKGSMIYIIQESLVSAGSSIGTVILLWSGASLCVKNIISLSDLFIFYYLISFFLEPVQNLINLQPQIQTAIVASERLNDILDVECEIDKNQDNNPDLKGDIEFKDVYFRYSNRDLVLDDLSLTFRKGSKTAIVGESGCGKTTAMKLLMSFYEPEKGSVLIGGKDISNYSSSVIRKKVAYISQSIFLFSDTIYNNLRMGNQNIDNEQIENICRLCLADEFINKLPMGYETVIEENGNNLSGGQRQRLAIARALLRDPDILIMDEATSNLDTISEKSIKETIDNLSSEKTCIIIAHRLNTIKNCDYIYVIENGHVAESGTHQELVDNGGLYLSYIRN